MDSKKLAEMMKTTLSMEQEQRVFAEEQLKQVENNIH